MLRVQRSLLIGCALALPLLFAGCGASGPAGANGSPATPTAKATSPAIHTSPPAGGGGPVTLSTDALHYQTGDTISVTLSNRSRQTIYFPDHLTNCTVILLQRQKAQPLAEAGERTGGTGVNPCQLAIVTRMHSLGPGQHLVVKLVAPKGGWPAGIYLATLSYRLSPSIGSSTALASPAFVVGSSAPQP